MNTLLPLALAYLNKGFSVICVGPDKIPLINWKNYQKRRASSDELVQWWTQYPDAQIGIVTGQISNLLVVDVEYDGDLNLITDETYTVKTGRGGKHFYFTHDGDFKNAVRILPSVDVRAEGGYVVAPGSITSKGSYEVIKDLPIAPMSPGTKQMLIGAKLTFKPQTTRGNTQTHAPIEYTGQSEGGRNDSLVKYIGAVLSRIHPSLWGTVGWGMVVSANQKNVPPLPESEVAASFRSISNKEISQHPNGRSYGNFSSREKVWGPEGEKKTTFQAGEENTHEHAVVIHVAEAARKQIIDTDTAFPIDIKPFDDALLGGFSFGEVVVVAGRTGCGKTTIMQSWTTTFAMGGETEHDPLPALWFSYEVLAKSLWEKFVLMGADETAPIYLPSYNESGDIEWVTRMIEEGITEKGIKVVAIDHIGFLNAPKGNYANKADAITHTVRRLKRLAVKHGLIILLPVHMRRTTRAHMDIEDIRDSGGIANEADTVFFIDREKEKNGTYKDESKIGLLKNRKTGVSVIEHLKFRFGRFYYEKAYSDIVKEGAAEMEKIREETEEDWKNF